MCLGDHYHKPLVRDEVTLSAAYTAPFRRAVVSLVVAPEKHSYEETLALIDHSVDSDGETLPASELIAPVKDKLLKRSHKKKAAPPGTTTTTTTPFRFPRSGPTPHNERGEEMPDQATMQPGPPDIPLTEAPEIAADNLQRGAEDPQRKLTIAEDKIWNDLPEAERRIATATVAKLHADLGHSSIRQMIGC